MFNLVLGLLLIPFLAVRVLLRSFWRRAAKKRVIGFFHPYCNDGGGGERVLWSLVRIVQQHFGEQFVYRVYHGDAALSSSDILRKTKERFGIELEGKVEFVRLARRNWVESKQYPALTMLGQAVGSVILGLDALLQGDEQRVDVMFDTMGYPFAYPVFWFFGGCRVLCYTHYPVISTDMLERVVQRRPAYNNDTLITRSATLSLAKVWYYRAFAWMYGVVGGLASLVLVNSEWTAEHIGALWRCKGNLHVVYPAVNTADVREFALEGRVNRIISISQFRPEKNHELQVRAFAEFCRQWASERDEPPPKLVMIGSVRNTDDEKVVSSVRAVATALQLKEGRDYEFAFNVPYKELLQYFRTSRVGLHTMWNEHFGIGIVELMAAGVVTIAHNSGGPKKDIMAAHPKGNKVGYLAESVQEYASAMHRVFCVASGQEILQLQRDARAAMETFSEKAFDERVSAVLFPSLE